MCQQLEGKRRKHFKKMLISLEVKGLVYEASRLSMEAADALDEAGKLSSDLLNRSLSYLGPHQARVVGNTLEYPHHKSLATFIATFFFFFLLIP